jgi:RNA polymerase sigma-70 factor, ECF subfamily
MSKRKFEKFYNKHIDKVYRHVFFRVSQDRELTDDLVSEIFLKALRKFSTYDKNKSISAWIMTITKNHLANHWRDKKPTVSLDIIDDNTELNKKQETTLLEKAKNILTRQQDTQHLYDLLTNLSEGDKEIVTLHYLCGYKYSEIAEMKELKVTTVKVTAHRAIKKLRKL